MDTRAAAAKYRLAQWAQRVQTRMQSGQSIKEYCTSAGISRNAYFYWQRKLREGACAELAGKERESGSSLVPDGWARLESAEPDHGDAVTIEIGGCRVRATAGADPELLAKVCRMLKAL